MGNIHFRSEEIRYIDGSASQTQYGDGHLLSNLLSSKSLERILLPAVIANKFKTTILLSMMHGSTCFGMGWHLKHSMEMEIVI